MSKEHSEIISLDSSKIQNLIYTIRGEQVMLDRDLAKIYGVESKRLNEAVKRNIERFPEKFRFQLNKDEEQNLRSQFATSSSKHGGRRYLPFVFREPGVAMLSTVLRSETAILVSIQIMDAFIATRKIIGSNAQLFQRLDRVELKQLEHDTKFNQIFDAIEQKEISPKQGIIYNGQIFDAHVFLSKIIKSAKKSIVIIDNYIDETVLTLLTKRKKGVLAKIVTKSISKRLELDVKKFNEQYEPITAEEVKTIHDRFLIIDEKDVYHSGASLKDLGKKISAFSKFDLDGLAVLGKLR